MGKNKVAPEEKKCKSITAWVDIETKKDWDLIPTKRSSPLLKKAIYDIIKQINAHKYEWQDKFIHNESDNATY